MRRAWNPSQAEDGAAGGRLRSFDVTAASSTCEYEGAFRLLHDQYVARGYMAPHPAGLRLSLHNALPTTKTFVARRRAEIIGTLSVIEHTQLGLPMAELYHAEIGDLLRQGRRIGEVSGLAVEPGMGAAGLGVVMKLIRMALLYAAKIVELDDLCISVNPRHAPFYRRALGFAPLGGLRSYQKVNGAPAVALRLDLHDSRRVIRDLHSGGVPDTELHDFLYGPAACARVIARLCWKVPRTRMTREQFHHFFGTHDAWIGASSPARDFVESCYSVTAPPATVGRRQQVPAALPEVPYLQPSAALA